LLKIFVTFFISCQKFSTIVENRKMKKSTNVEKKCHKRIFVTKVSQEKSTNVDKKMVVFGCFWALFGFFWWFLAIFSYFIFV